MSSAIRYDELKLSGRNNYWFSSQTFANGSNCRSHKKKSHPQELAALEASGKTAGSAQNIPRLEQLQPKVEARSGNLVQIPMPSNDKQAAEQNPDKLQEHQTLQSIATPSFIGSLPAQ